ncbi:MAG: hypothetical protein JZU65_06795 [Chlorobium sp.]|nr:hypothetical protein [Chlorobium sp.]
MPNYSLCTDKEDISQLIDGETESHGMWRNLGTVGWAGDLGVIRIVIEVLDNSNSHSYRELAIHTVSKPSKGVEYPVQIDVFAIEGDGKNSQIVRKNYEEAPRIMTETMWLTLPLEKAPKKLLLVIKPKGNFFFCDEIRLSSMVSPANNGESFLGVNEPSTEKFHKWKKEIGQAYQAKKALREETTSEIEVVPWVVENPFSKLPVNPTLEELHRSTIAIDIHGSKNEKESACIGIINLSEIDKDVVVDLSGSLDLKKALTFSIVKPVLAANEEVVYDPLQPIVIGEKMLLTSQRASYLWVQFDLEKMPAGEQSGEIILNFPDKQGQLKIPLRMKVGQVRLTKSLPYAVNWGYSNDLPIWEDKKAALADNLSHNVNVAVIHSSKIPLLDVEQNWSSQKADLLLQEIAFYRDMKTVLLFLNLGEGKGPESLRSLSIGSVSQKAIVQKWVLHLVALLESSGVPKSSWALYPVDEPHDKDLEYLRILAGWIKEVAPEIQIYANPTSDKSIIADLSELDDFVDIWQPHYQCAAANVPFFSKLKKEWWLYQNPPPPAKSASPWLHYRLLSWKAWQLGASGVGFWSYSDTGKTSAWDDLDGIRPDRSVVYERQGLAGPLSSRRWEAFRDGIEDYQLLTASKLDELLVKNSNTQQHYNKLLTATEPSFSDVKMLRRELLELLDCNSSSKRN